MLQICFEAHGRSLRLEGGCKSSWPRCFPLQRLAIFRSVGNTLNPNYFKIYILSSWLVFLSSMCANLVERCFVAIEIVQFVPS